MPIAYWPTQDITPPTTPRGFSLLKRFHDELHSGQIKDKGLADLLDWQSDGRNST